MTAKKVLILGGRGHFGQLLAEDLRQHVRCELTIASRHSRLESLLSDVCIAISAAGPFQTLPTTLAETCVARGIHYIDLADSRDFVRRIHGLVRQHRGDLPAVCTAWSTVSALSGVLASIAGAGVEEKAAVYIHMAPGNRIARGRATIASLLHSVGTSFQVFRDDSWQIVSGWSEPRDFCFPSPIGRRRGYLVDVPDHELFPELFHARTVEFRTSLELEILNKTLAALSWCVERGIVTNWAPWARVFHRASAVFSFAGHDWGGVGVEVIGPKIRRRVSIIADDGGQRIAVLPAAVMVESLLAGQEWHGLVSHENWLDAGDLKQACIKRGFRLVIEDA